MLKPLSQMLSLHYLQRYVVLVIIIVIVVVNVSNPCYKISLVILCLFNSCGAATESIEASSILADLKK